MLGNILNHVASSHGNGSSDTTTTSMKAKTMSLQGQDYAKVSSRLAEYHKAEKEPAIETSYQFDNGYLITTATVHAKGGTFTGHSFGKVDKVKAFEKLETVAVGRALAFAGFLADGEIASYEEMEDYETAKAEPTWMTEQ